MPTPTLDELARNGIVHALADACAQAVQEVAAAATPEHLIRLCARQVADAGELTAEGVAAHLNVTLAAFKASTTELLWAEAAGRD